MEAKGRRWTGWIAVVAASATVLAMAAPAGARLTAESGSVTIAPQQIGTATAACRSASDAVAGGFAAPGFDPTAETGPAILPYASNRPSSRTWQATGHNFHQSGSGAKVDPGSGQLNAYAYCDGHDPSISVRSKSITLAASDHGSVTVDCARGGEAVSGGFRSDEPNEKGNTDFVYTSERVSDQGWKISAQNADSLSAHSVSAFVYCEKHGPKLVSRGAAEALATQDTVTITPNCPKDGRIFSGGYKSTFSDANNDVDDGFAYTSKRAAGNKWKVSAFGNRMGSGSTETAFAYCAV